MINAYASTWVSTLTYGYLYSDSVCVVYVGIRAECIDMLIRERRTGHGIAARGKFENNLAQWTMRLCVCCIASDGDIE